MTSVELPLSLLQDDRLARRLFRLFVIGAPPAFGLLALMLGQDANWDLRNYHWYNAYAFLTGRFGFDLAPAQTATFYNPVLDVPFFLAASTLPAPLVGFLLGSVQGLNAVLLFLLAHRLVRLETPSARVLAAAAIALVGMLGGMGLALLGTTFYDNVVSLGVLGALLVVAARHAVLFHGPPAPAAGWAALAGLMVGASMGLKQPSVVYAVGLCGAFLLAAGTTQRRLWLAFCFGLGVLAGIAAFSGHWMWTLWQAYGNPLFPYFNDLFQSPWTAAVAGRDMKFMPQTWVEHVFAPLFFAFEPYRVAEIAWRDLRIPLLFVLLPAAALVAVVHRRPPVPIAEPAPAHYLLAAAALSYAVWAVLFMIYRYLVPLEMLAPLAIVLTVGLLPLARRTRWALAAALLAAIQITISPGDWTRVPWSGRFITVEMPEIPQPERSMVLMAGTEPSSFLIPALPPEVPVLRIMSYFSQPEEPTRFNAELRTRIAGHDGPFYILYAPYEEAAADHALQAFGLQRQAAACRPVRNNLTGPFMLCDVQRMGSG